MDNPNYLYPIYNETDIYAHVGEIKVHIFLLRNNAGSQHSRMGQTKR